MKLSMVNTIWVVCEEWVWSAKDLPEFSQPFWISKRQGLNFSKPSHRRLFHPDSGLSETKFNHYISETIFLQAGPWPWAGRFPLEEDRWEVDPRYLLLFGKRDDVGCFWSSRIFATGWGGWKEPNDSWTVGAQRIIRVGYWRSIKIWMVKYCWHSRPYRRVFKNPDDEFSKIFLKRCQL